MKQKRYSQNQIMKILKEAETGLPILDLCRKYGISKSSYYKWKSKYGGLEVAEAERLKALEIENRRLKQMYAELSLEYQVLKEVVEKKL